MGEGRKKLLNTLNMKKYPGVDSDRRNCGQPYEDVLENEYEETDKGHDSNRQNCGKPYQEPEDDEEPEL